MLQRKRENSPALLIPRRPWRRFQWRLTLLYLVASILTSLLIQTAISAYYIYVYVYSSDVPAETAETMAQAEPQVARFFVGARPDVAGLTRWLDQQRLEEGFPGIGFLHGQESVGMTAIVITRLDGVILTATPDSKAFPPGAVLDSLCAPEERRLLDLARHGTGRAQRSGGRILAAAPIHSEGKLVALGFLRSGKHYTLANAVLGSSAILLSSAFLTALGGAVIGGLFGYATARSVNRRLETIASAAARWASGDLQAAAPEEPKDEFGLLGRCLNGMATDLEQVISLRRRVAALEERQKITRDLHDTVKQQAFATAMLVGSAQERLDVGDMEGLRESLNQAEILSQGMQEELRAILKEFRAAVALPLGERLARLTTDWTQHTGIPIHLEVSSEAANLTPAITDEITLIVQEALANAAKHSAAGRVDVILRREMERWDLTVADNGRGIENGRGFGEGLGLQTMRERAGELPEGRFEMISAPGVGTRITVTFLEARK